MKPNAKARISFYVTGIFYVLSAASNVVFAFMLQRIVDSANTGDVSILVYYIVLLLGLWAADYITIMLAIVFRLTYVKEMLLIAKRHRLGFLFTKRQKSPAGEDSNDLSFFTTDADILGNSYFTAKARIPLYIAEFAFTLGALIWINWAITASVIAVTMLPILGTSLFAKGLRKRKKAYSNSAAMYVSTVSECIDGKKEIVAYDKQQIFLSRHDAANSKIESARFKSDFFEILANRTAAQLGALVFITAIGLGTYFVITGNMTFGYMIAVVQLMNSLMNPVNNLSSEINSIRSAKNIVEKAGEENEPEAVKIAAAGFNSELQIRNLGVSYTQGEYIFKNLHLNFAKGGKYALFAPSGYGKTSIAKAIALEFTEYDGTITLDRQEIRQINQSDYHKILRYVRQDPYVFNDTAINNLTFFDPQYSRVGLNKVLELTRVNEFLPDEQALTRQISNTSGLSGGQKQRIVLARALLHAPQVLILDEITSGIDLDTAYNILRDLFRDKELTCITITHESDERFLGLFDEVIQLPDYAKHGKE